MATIGTLHLVYLVMTLLIITALLFKKEIVLPSVFGIFLMGLFATGHPIKAVQVLYNALVVAGGEFLGIIVVIALVVSMTRTLATIGADELMIRPLKNAIRSNKVAFFIVGAVMLVASWFIWPSPAVALVGALLLPFALKAGLPAIWAAVAMNLFGHGIGLSSDFFIQGAPSITAKAAGVGSTDIMLASVPIWLVMSIVTIIVAFIMFLKDLKENPQIAVVDLAATESESKVKFTTFSYVMAVITPLAFVLDVFFMVTLKIVGGDATALVGGTAILIMTIILIGKGDLMDSLDEITDKFKEGFIFAIKIFAPVIVIAGFFFLGSGQIAAKILGEGAPDILTDYGMYLAGIVPMAKFPVVIIQTLIAVVTGLDGSGFSGLPLVGSLAQTFSVATGANVSSLAALGQVVTIWVGGGTIIPWGVIPVAAICNVKPGDLARKNLIPVLSGIAAAVIVTMFLV